MSNIGVPGLSNYDSDNQLSIQQSEVAQLGEENRLLDESLTEDGVGLTGGQFFSPCPDSDIGRNYFSSVRSTKLFQEEQQQRSVNNDAADIDRSEFLSS